MTDSALKFLKKPLKSFRRFFLGLTSTHKNVERTHNYWRKPDDGANQPTDYLLEKANLRSEFLVKLIKQYTSTDASILEIGCNAGRNLDFLYRAGFTNLEAIEISAQAIELLKKTFPKMAQAINLHNGAVEDILPKFNDSRYDVVFTMAVLEHIHTDSQWIFPEMSRITKKFLITIEDEKQFSWRHFPRNYQKTFEQYGLRQVEETSDASQFSLPDGFVARVFEKTA